MPENPEKEKEYLDITQGKGHTRVYLSTARVIINNFLGGLAWGFGTVLGATVVVGLVILIFSKLNSLPVIGQFFTDILLQLQQ